MLKIDLKQLALRLASEGPVKTLATPKRIRILYNGAYVADSTKAVFIWEHEYYPQYYLPRSAFDMSKVTQGEKIMSENCEHIATNWTIAVGGKSTTQALCFVDDLEGKGKVLSGLVKANFTDFDQWFEEDSPIFVHPKDPFKRVDIVASSRSIKVEVDGHIVAEATSSMHLYETGLPVRYYLPFTSIDVSKLQTSSTRTQCPYKGEAEYYSLKVGGEEHKDIVWYYRTPTIESSAVTGLCCFYNEKVDISIQEDGKWKRLDRPQTVFS